MKDQQVTRIETGQSLKSFLTSVIDEGMKSALAQRALTEKEKQAKAAGGGGGNDIDSLFGGGGGDDSGAANAGGGDNTDVAPDKSSDDSGDDHTTSKTMDGENEKLQDADIEAKDVVDKLNAIRSGKSFKDSAVAGPMEEWINSLSKTERVALYAFLRGISQIVTGEVPAAQAEDPSKHPSDVKMNKSNEPHVKHANVNVIKGSPAAPNNPQKKKAPPEEDTSGPVPSPITPKRR